MNLTKITFFARQMITTKIMKTLKQLIWVLGICTLLVSCKDKEFFGMRGVVLTVDDLETVDWPKLAYESGINTIGTHITPNQVATFMQSEKGKKFSEDCRKYGIDVEHQLHAMKELLPRELFAEDSTMFRMNEQGRRTDDWNCCPSSQKALEIIAANAAKYAEILPSTNHRYYYWLDDGMPTCECPLCHDLSDSDQALLIENAMIKGIRKVDPEAMLAHLSYANTLEAPRKVTPEEGIFLEFAPIMRSWEHPLADTTAAGRGMTHKENLAYLKENLEVFPAETAVVLEYWLDVSLFSNWTKPAVELPWNKDVFQADLKTYAKFGIRDITTFAVYMDSVYFANYPNPVYLKEYGQGFADFKKEQ